MKQLVIIAFPQDAAKLAILDDTTPEPAPESQMCWGPQIVSTAVDLIEKNPTVEKVIFYGPQDYVKPFVSELNEKFENVEVEIGDLS